MIEEVTTSETSVKVYQTARSNIPEDSHIYWKNFCIGKILITEIHLGRNIRAADREELSVLFTDFVQMYAVRTDGQNR
jgi:hypothetical protein